MATYIVRQAFLAFSVGQVVYSDADAVGRAAGSVITDAQVAGHTAALVAVTSSGGGTSTGGTGTSTGGTSTTGTGTPTGGTGTGTGSGAAPSGVYIVSATPNSDGSIIFVDSTGATHTSSPTANGSLTTQQAQQLAATSNVVNSLGQVTAPVVGDVLGATFGTLTAAQVLAQVSGHTAHLLSLDTGLSAINTTESNTGTTLAQHTAQLGTHTAQLGTLASGLASAGSLAVAASTLAGSALGTPSIVNGALSFKTAAGAAGPTVTLPPGATPTLSIGGVSSGATASASISGSPAAPVLNFVIPPGAPGNPGATPAISIGTVSSGTSAAATFTGSATAPVLNLMLQKGDPGQGTQGIPGATGSAAGGDVGTNLATSAAGAKSLPLQSIFRRKLDSDDFGTQHNGTTINGYLGVTTRAALAAYTNAYGAQPYKFMGTVANGGVGYPVSTGDDVEVYAPVATASGSILTLAVALTLPIAASGYTGPTGLYQNSADKHWYLYTAGTPWTQYQPGMFATNSALAAGTKVLATQTNCIRITDQAAGTTLAAGGVVTIGANMPALKVGQQVWAPQGIQPQTTITAVGALTVTLSQPVDTTSKTTYGVQISGVFPLAIMHIFTPMAEANICSTITMDSLALPAAWWNQRLDDASRECAYASRGDHYVNIPLRFWGHAGGLRGAGVQDTFIRTMCSGFAVFSFFPTQATVAHYGDYSVRPSTNGAFQQAFLYIEGSCEIASNQNNNGTGSHQPIIHRMSGQANGPYTDTSVTPNVYHPPSGPAQLVRLRHCGGVYNDDLFHLGYGLDPSPYASCTLSVGNVVAVHNKRVGGDYVQAAIISEGYLEHPILEDCSTAPSGSVLDLDQGSTFGNGNVACLICEIRGGDIDIYYFGYRIVMASSVTFNGTEIQAPETARANTTGLSTAGIIQIIGCQGGTVVGLNGGGNTGYDMIEVGNAGFNGGSFGTTGVAFGFLQGGGLASTLRIAAGCNGNLIDDATIILNGSTTGAVIDGGANYHTSSAAGTATTSAYDATLFFGHVGGNTTLGTSPAAMTLIPMAPDGDVGNNFDGTGYLVRTTGSYDVEADFPIISTGTAATTAAPVAPAGTQGGVQLWFDNQGGAVQNFTTQPKDTTARFRHTVYVQKGTLLRLYGYADVATTVLGGAGSRSHVRIKQCA